jgi:RimJ/RimL family protein N-acetyltransferase
MYRRSLRHLRIRPLRPGERRVVESVFAGLSPESRERRFLAPVEVLTPTMLAALCDVAPGRQVAFVAETRKREPVGIARYIVDGPRRAEIAYEVVDAWQGRGVGSRLLRALVDRARADGLASVHGTVHRDNEASMALLRRVLPQLRVQHSGDLLEVRAVLDVEPLHLDDVLAELQKV